MAEWQRQRTGGGRGVAAVAAQGRQHSSGIGSMVAASAEAAQQHHGGSNQRGVSDVSGVAVWAE